MPGERLPLTSINSQFESLLAHVLAACQQRYGPRLVSVAVFGSVGRGTPHPESDLDLLIVQTTSLMGGCSVLPNFAP